MRGARGLRAAREAGAKIELVVCATIFGMAFGGYISGVIFDLTGSYRAAFLNELLWNLLNLAIVGWLFWRRRRVVLAGVEARSVVMKAKRAGGTAKI